MMWQNYVRKIEKTDMKRESRAAPPDIDQGTVLEDGVTGHKINCGIWASAVRRPRFGGSN